MKHKNKFFLLLIISMTNLQILPSISSFALSSIIGGAIFYKSKDYEKDFVRQSVPLRRDLVNAMSDLAETIEASSEAMKDLFSQVSKIKNKNKWFWQRWYRTYQSRRDAQRLNNSAVNHLEASAEELNDVDIQEVRNFAKRNYIYVRAFASVMSLYLSNKILKNII